MSLFLNKTRPTIKLQPYSVYYMGASDSPKKILYLGQVGNIAQYLQYPFSTTKISQNDAGIFISLVQQGTETQLKSRLAQKKKFESGDKWAFFYPWMNEEIDLLQIAIDGKQQKTFDPIQLSHWRVYIKYNGSGDGWSILEETAHINIDGQNMETEEYSGSVDWEKLQEILKPHFFRSEFTLVRMERNTE